jgi:hypothetical protein
MPVALSVVSLCLHVSRYSSLARCLSLPITRMGFSAGALRVTMTRTLTPQASIFTGAIVGSCAVPSFMEVGLLFPFGQQHISAAAPVFQFCSSGDLQCFYFILSGFSVRRIFTDISCQQHSVAAATAGGAAAAATAAQLSAKVFGKQLNVEPGRVSTYGIRRALPPLFPSSVIASGGPFDSLTGSFHWGPSIRLTWWHLQLGNNLYVT